MDWKSANPGTPNFFNNSLKTCFFWAEKPWKFSGIFRRSFCEGRELRRPKSNHVHPAFSCFFPFLTPPKRSWKSKVSPPPSNQGFLGPCPDDRAQKVVPIALNESSVRPNPTLVFAKIFFNLWELPIPDVCKIWGEPIAPEERIISLLEVIFFSSLFCQYSTIFAVLFSKANLSFAIVVKHSPISDDNLPEFQQCLTEKIKIS